MWAGASTFNHLLMEFLIDLTIFAGIYVYLIQNQGCTHDIYVVGVPNCKLIKLPFLFLIYLVAAIIGKFITAAFSSKYRFTSFSFLLFSGLNLLMVGQIAGYSTLRFV